jgi:hypothetical protein
MKPNLIAALLEQELAGAWSAAPGKRLIYRATRSRASEAQPAAVDLNHRRAYK